MIDVTQVGEAGFTFCDTTFECPNEAGNLILQNGGGGSENLQMCDVIYG